MQSGQDEDWAGHRTAKEWAGVVQNKATMAATAPFLMYIASGLNLAQRATASDAPYRMSFIRDSQQRLMIAD